MKILCVAVTVAAVAVVVAQLVQKKRQKAEADRKVTVYYGTKPEVVKLTKGDIWIKTDGTNLLAVWDGSDWVRP